MWKRSARLTSEIDSAGVCPGSLASDFEPLFHGLTGYAHAKERLVAWGYSKETVDAMAVGQVLSIYSARIYETVADEWEKGAYVDFPAGQRLYDEAYDAIREHDWQSDHPDREIIPIASTLLPAVMAAQKAAFRTERDFDALRVIEALRMHAAANEGKWPESLDDIKSVPVPKNVATGEPFEYQLKGDTAVLTLPMSDGFNVEKQFELAIDK